MKNEEIGIGQSYTIRTSIDDAEGAHRFNIGQNVLVVERVLNSGFRVKDPLTGIEQFVTAKDLKPFEIKPAKPKLTTDILKSDFEGFLELRDSAKFNMYDPKVREVLEITKEQHVEILSKFSQLKSHFKL
jgi:hypothetical protein